jgi:hypothetical protein
MPAHDFRYHHGGDGPARGHKDDRKEYVREWFWACCNCGAHAGMSTGSVGCPGCDHVRCDYCPMEVVKIRVSNASIGGIGRGGAYPAPTFPAMQLVYRDESSIVP